MTLLFFFIQKINIPFPRFLPRGTSDNQLASAGNKSQLLPDLLDPWLPGARTPSATVALIPLPAAVLPLVAPARPKLALPLLAPARPSSPTLPLLPARPRLSDPLLATDQEQKSCIPRSPASAQVPYFCKGRPWHPGHPWHPNATKNRRRASANGARVACGHPDTPK